MIVASAARAAAEPGLSGAAGNGVPVLYEITSPANRAPVVGVVEISLSTTLPIGNAWWNELDVDGVPSGVTDAGHYLQFEWDSTKFTNGAHTLAARAHQQNTGTITATSSITVIVSNGLPTPTPTLTPTPIPAFNITSPAAGAKVSGTAAISVTGSLILNQDWWNDLLVDGAATGLTDAGHYQRIDWNSTSVSNGAHTLTVRAHQKTTGRVNASASVTINVKN